VPANSNVATQMLTYKYRLLPSRGQHDKLRAALDHTRDPTQKVSKASARQEAKAAGQTSYVGRPCKYGHGGLKWVSNGVCVECNAICHRRWRAEHQEHEAARQSQWYASNRKTAYARHQRWRVEHPEKAASYARQWQKANPGRTSALAAKHRAAKRKATPKWLTSDQIARMAEMYDRAAALGFHVDHIVPLAGKNVCGLHVPWNLQLLSPADNIRKHNRFIGDDARVGIDPGPRNAGATRRAAGKMCEAA
jgi:hypothetical protein